MEACVVVCRRDKPPERRGKILFINAVGEVTRERAQSFLTDAHIRRIVDAYHGFEDIEGFARVVGNDEVLERDGNLNIPLYVRMSNGAVRGERENATLQQALADWQRDSRALRDSMNGLFETLRTATDSEAKPEPAPKVVQPAFKRAVLAAEVVSALHREPTFGSVKHEKVVFLCEKHLGLERELDHRHLRQAAGPYDPRARRSIESNFKKLKWFDVVREGGRVTYFPGEKFGAHSEYFGRYFVDAQDEIEWIVELLRPLNSARCEMIATLYSVWSDYLDQGISPTDDKIVDDALNWHEKKRRFSRELWLRNLKWMKENGLIPTKKLPRTIR